MSSAYARAIDVVLHNYLHRASILTLKVASQVEVKNGTVQTIFTKGDIFSKMGNHGSPKTEANLDDASMTCEVHFDESVHLGMISPTWNSPTQKSVQHNDLYFFEYWRIELLHTVGSRLTLRHQSDDQDVYGKYVCSFIFKDVGQIELDVYLKTAPILILPIIPPPPPLLETGLANPACSQNHASANLTALWHQACKIVVAYPPVSASDHAWNWSNGEATLSTIRLATDPQLIGEKLEVFESLYKQADGEQRRRGCSGLLVQQNVTTSSSHQTTAFFWCYAENEVGKTFVRWPQEYHASNLSKWPTWLLVVQVMGAAFTASALIWCFCWRYPYRRCLMFERVSRWTSHHSFVPLSHQDDCRLIMVGPTEDGSDLGNDFGSDVGILDDVDDYVHEYLENVSKIHSRSSVTERLTFVDKSFLPQNQSDILKSCLEYAELKNNASQDLTIQELTAFQLKRFNESQDLKRRVFSLYSEWLSMKPLFSDFVSVCENPPKITATDFKDPVASLSELLKMSGEIFTSVQKLLFRYSGAESEISSDLLWCCNSINRLIESEKFADLKKIDISPQAISSKLDIIISKLNEVIAESVDTLSVSRSGRSGRVLGDSKGRRSADNYSTNSSLLFPFSPILQSSNQVDKKTAEEVNLDEAIGTTVFEAKDEVHVTDPDNQSKEDTFGSILKSPRAFEIYHCNDPINDPEADFNCDEMPAKSILKLSSFSFSPENSNFTDDVSKWPTWLLVVQVMGAAFTASALIWCFCWRYPYRRCLMFERVSRWTSHHSFVPLSHQDDCRLIMVGPTEDGSDLGNDFGSDVGILDDVDDYVHEYLENVSKIHSRSSVTERLTFVDKSFLPQNQSDILKSCLEYAELKNNASQDLTIQELTAFQLKRFNESQDLKRRVFSLYSEWLSMKPLFSDFVSVCENPPKITATDFKDPVASLSELLKMSGEIFTSVQKLLFRYSGAESEISSDLLWCCNSINRLIESEKFADLKKIDISPQAISSKLDIIISKLNEVIAESVDTLSVSRSGRSGRVLGDSKGRRSADNYSTNSSLLFPFSPILQSSNQVDKKTAEEVNLDEAIGTTVFEAKDEVHVTDPDNQSKEDTFGSILKSPRAFEIYHCNDPINDPEADFNCDEMPAKSILKLSSFSFSPENSNFTDDDALFNDINNELASLLHTTTLRDRRTGDEEEDGEENLIADAGEFKIPLQREVPPITPLLMPSRLSNPRTSLKSLRFGTPISSERRIEKDDEYVDENENKPVENLSSTPYLKSFSEFSCRSVDISTAKPLRPPFSLVTSNFENNPRLSELPTFADLCAKSVNNNSNSTNRTDEIAKSGSVAGEEDDESLGLLSFGDMDNPDSEFLMMSQ
nr:hypothetical transcript [Hymenolepis microstoma]